MIVTITLNPSIDISYPLPEFKLDTVNRVTEVRKTAGGKGLNVTRVLKQLDADVLASGLLGGCLGDSIKTELSESNIKHSFAQINGETRNCIAILHEGKQTEILESGPFICEREAAAFLKHFKDLVADASILSFSGSLPEGLPVDFYAQMLTICQQQAKPVVMDCSGEALKSALIGEAKPLLIKPNLEELAGLLGRPIASDDSALQAALSDPLFTDVDWIVVSLGAQGAFAKHADTFYRVTIPKIAVVNPVGSGDATVAGFVAALAANESDEAILKKGNALGMLNAQEPLTGYVNLANYQQLYEQITVKKL